VNKDVTGHANKLLQNCGYNSVRFPEDNLPIQASSLHDLNYVLSVSQRHKAVRTEVSCLTSVYFVQILSRNMPLFMAVCTFNEEEGTFKWEPFRRRD
jgi:hypothetical protein